MGGAGAWTFHLLLAYLIAEFACVAGLDHSNILGITRPALWLLAVSSCLIVVSLASTIVAYRSLTRIERAGAGDRASSADRYLARTGSWLSGLFTIIILIESIPIFFYLDRC